MNKQEIEKTIANVEQQLASIKAELLKQDEHAEKWERKGNYILSCNGRILQEYEWYTEQTKKQGRTYQTFAAAQSVKPYDAFYGLLCGLACELNPSGKAGGKWCVRWNTEEFRWSYFDYVTWKSNDELFETAEAAYRAVEILNRDCIKPPLMEDPK